MTSVLIEAEPMRAPIQIGVCSDDVLAAMATRGNGPAFSELARRHSRLVASAMRRRLPALASDDLRQEALVGLLEACHAEREPGTFSAVARACVRCRVRKVYGDALREALATLDRAVVIGWPLPDQREAVR
jgi:DNA-directed RNA polymerase specialized sigma24 family protein